jgi:hypothetical protein
MFSSFFIQSINGLTTGFILSGKWFNSTTALDNEHCTLKLHKKKNSNVNIFTKFLWCNNIFQITKEAWVAKWIRSLDLTAHTNLSPIRRGFAPSFVNYKKRCTRLAAASDKAYQLLAHGRWFTPGTPASSTTKTGRHDKAEILLKLVLSTKNQINQSS